MFSELQQQGCSSEIEEGEIIEGVDNAGDSENKESENASPKIANKEEITFINKSKRKRSCNQQNNTNSKNANSKLNKNANGNKTVQKKNKITVPCRYFHVNHNCIKGDKCQFSHAEIPSEEIKIKMFQEQEQFIFKCREKYGKTFIDKEFDYYLQFIKPHLNPKSQSIPNASTIYFPGYNDIPIYPPESNFFNFCYPPLCIDPNIVNSIFPLETNVYPHPEANQVALNDLIIQKECDKDNSSTKGECTTKNNSFYSEKELTKSSYTDNDAKKDSAEISPIHRSITLENMIDNNKATDPRLRVKK